MSRLVHSDEENVRCIVFDILTAQNIQTVFVGELLLWLFIHDVYLN